MRQDSGLHTEEHSHCWLLKNATYQIISCVISLNKTFRLEIFGFNFVILGTLVFTLQSIIYIINVVIKQVLLIALSQTRVAAMFPS